MFCRAPWVKGTTQSGAATDENHWFIAGPCDIQCWGPKKDALLFTAAWKVARVEVTQCARTPAHILPQAGGPCACSTSHREHVCGQLTFLNNSFFYGTWHCCLCDLSTSSVSTVSIHFEAGYLDNPIIFVDENFSGNLHDLPASYHDITHASSWRLCIARPAPSLHKGVIMQQSDHCVW